MRARGCCALLGVGTSSTRPLWGSLQGADSSSRPLPAGSTEAKLVFHQSPAIQQTGCLGTAASSSSKRAKDQGETISHNYVDSYRVCIILSLGSFRIPKRKKKKSSGE